MLKNNNLFKIKNMKNIIKNYLILFVLALAISSCNDDDKVTDDVQNEFTVGGVLRTIQTISGSLNVIDLNSVWSIEIEEQDSEDGDLLSSVNVYVNLQDNTSGGTTSTTETLIASYDASQFTDGPFGLPRMTLAFTLGDFADALGIVEGEFNCGDQFEVRLELLMTDGRIFSKDDIGSSVTGGFFATPFEYRPFLIALLPSDTLYEGQYELTTTIPGIFGVSDYADGIYTIGSVTNTTKVIKNVVTFPAFGGFGPVNLQFQFICGEIILTAGQSVGAGCNSAIISGPADVNATYDLNNPDDTDFIINFTSDTTSDCVAPTQAAIRLVKQ